MNIKRTTYIISLCACILLIISCAKEQIIRTNPEITFPVTEEIIACSVTGKVLDEDRAPIEGATVTCISAENIQSVQTDKNGNFLFEDISNKGQSAYIKVTYTSKFDGYRRYGLIENKHNYTEIILQDKTPAGRIESQEGGQLSGPKGSSVTLPPNGIVDGSGNIYNGTVEVFMAWIDPSSSSLSQLMVGNLSGVDNTGELKSLATYGMLNVELFDPAGNELNVKEGSAADLSFPIPASMMSAAPETIPLWSFDETYGYWVEESTAILSNGFYTGEVGHFSVWNADIKIDAIDICGQVILEYGNVSRSTTGASYYKIVLSNSRIGRIGGWLCDDGQFKFQNVPQGEIFLLEIFDLCGEVVHSEEIGPFDIDEVIDPIVINTSEIDFQIITGNGLDCDNETITDGFVKLDFNNDVYSYPLDSEGQFNFPVPICDNFVGEITVVDRLNATMSEPIIVTELDSLFEFNNIYVCQELDKYFKVNIEGVLDTVFLDFGFGTTFLPHYGFNIVQNTGTGFQIVMNFKEDRITGNVNEGADVVIFFSPAFEDAYYYESLDLQLLNVSDTESIFSGTIMEKDQFTGEFVGDEVFISGSWKE